MKNRIEQIEEFKIPIIANTTTEQEEAEKALEQRFALLFDTFNIAPTAPNAYRQLCLRLLVEVIGLQGFQILDELPKHAGGAPVVWTIQRHASLLEFLETLARDDVALKDAIGQARDKFSAELSDSDLKDGRVRAEFYRAKRFFEGAPTLAAAMLALEEVNDGAPGSALADFMKAVAFVATDYGYQKVASSHIGGVTRDIDEVRRPNRRKD